jgi:hypothetical protein
MNRALPILSCLIFAGLVSASDDRQSTYQRVEREYDRASGRVTDDATHQLDLIERSHRPVRPIERLELDRDREERLARQRQREDREERSRTLRIPPSPFKREERDAVEPYTRALMMQILAAVERLKAEEARPAPDPAVPATQPHDE